MRGRILVKDRVSSPPCVEGSSKILSARLVWRVADQRIALLPAMHTEEQLGGRPRLAGPPLTAPRPEVDGGEWRVPVGHARTIEACSNDRDER